MILFSKVITYFISAIWGMILGVFVPVTMLTDPELSEIVPAYVPILWLSTSVVCYIVPCFLMKLKLNKIAAVLTLAGAVSLIVIHISLAEPVRDSSGFEWFYLPLLAETVAVCGIAATELREKREARDNAPAESVLSKKSDPFN
jgi:hypothetical protein